MQIQVLWSRCGWGWPVDQRSCRGAWWGRVGTRYLCESKFLTTFIAVELLTFLRRDHRPNARNYSRTFKCAKTSSRSSYSLICRSGGAQQSTSPFTKHWRQQRRSLGSIRSAYYFNGYCYSFNFIRSMRVFSGITPWEKDGALQEILEQVAPSWCWAVIIIPLISFGQCGVEALLQEKARLFSSLNWLTHKIL